MSTARSVITTVVVAVALMLAVACFEAAQGASLSAFDGADVYLSCDDTSNRGTAGSKFDVSATGVSFSTANALLGHACSFSSAGVLTLGKPLVDSGTGWTFAAWFRNLAPSGARTLFGSASGEVILGGSSASPARLVSNGDDLGAKLSDSLQSDGVWHHIAIINTLTSRQVFLDGAKIVDSSVGTVPSSLAAISTLGSDATGTERFADALDEIYLYHFQIPESSVMDMYLGALLSEFVVVCFVVCACVV